MKSTPLSRFVFIAAMLTAAAASAQARDLLGDDGGGADPWPVTFAPEIVKYFPLAASLVAFVLCLTLHWLASRMAGQTWSGRAVGYATVWLLPVLVALLTYAALCAGLLLFATQHDDFMAYLHANATGGVIATWSAGFVLSILPFLARIVVPARTATR